MTQKVLKVGGSAAVTIPKKSLQDLNLKIGDRISVEVDRTRRTVMIKPFIAVDKELVDWTQKFIRQYREALEFLAKH